MPGRRRFLRPALALVLGGVAVPVLAVSAASPAAAVMTSVGDLQTAIDTAPSGGTVTLDADLSGGGLVMPSGRTITLDLNGHQLTVTGKAGTPGLEDGDPGINTFGATLTITDSSPLANGTLTASGGYFAAGIGTAAEYPPTGRVTIDAGSVVATGGHDGAGIGGGYLADGVTVLIEGGTVTANGGAGGAGIGGGLGGAGADVTITGGTVSARGGDLGFSGGSGGTGIGSGGTGGNAGSGGGGGTLTVGAGADVTATGAPPAYGDAAQAAVGSNGATPYGSVSNAGTLTLVGQRQTVYPPVTLTNEATGIIHLRAPVDGGGTVANDGTILVETGGSFDLSQVTVTDHAYFVRYDVNGVPGYPPPAVDTVWAGSYDAAGLALPTPPPGYGWATAAAGGTVVDQGTDLGSPGVFGSDTVDGSGAGAGFSNETLYLVPVPTVITNLTPPRITGATTPYSTLTVSPGTWDPAMVPLTYQWFLDGAPIPGETGSSYVVRPGDVGHRITAGVTGSLPVADPVTAYAVATDVVQPCTFAHTTTTTVSGSPAVGEILEAHPGLWSPDPNGFSYQWLADGRPIPGATAQTLTVPAAQAGTQISVRVTVSKPGCTDATATSDVTPDVAEVAVHLVSRPTITGDPAVGHPLTATPGTWDPATVVVSYQWLRGGTPIPGATGAAYTPVGADTGKFLSVVVTAAAPGYTDANVTAPAEFPVAGGRLTSTTPPTILGSPVAGHALTATPGGWSARPDHVSFQWYAGPLPIPGATDDTLDLDRADLVGRPITVEATATATGYAPATATSAATDPVAKAPVTMTRTLSTRAPFVGRTRVRIDLSITTATGLVPAGTVRVLVDGRPVTDGDLDADGKAELTLPVFTQKGPHKVRVVYGGSHLTDSARKTTWIHAIR